tara:strand:- start:194 stop:943 length:750 start_codon:yes stop_codon:yes gene_type:complete
MIRLLELFSGTHSVGKIAKKKDWYIVSLDRDLDDKNNISDIHIKEDIMIWDYKKYPKNSFDVIWASPVCCYWSHIQNTWIGRTKKGMDRPFTKEDIEFNINKFGKPMVDKVREIIDYFNPKYYFIENPKSSKMKTYITDLPFYDVDYCKYSNWGYQKSTRFWTNLKGFEPKICKKDCENIVITGKQKLHKERMGTSKTIIDNEKIVRVNTKDLRIKYKDYQNIQNSNSNLLDRYRIPPKLIEELLKDIK